MTKDGKYILKSINIIDQIGNLPISVKNIRFDSREIEEGDAFVAIRGAQTDGHTYIDTACAQGARLIVVESLPATIQNNVCYVKVEDTHLALAVMAANFFQNPSQQLHLVGITGTNGKTSIATLLHQLFTNMGYMCGLISTIENKIGTKRLTATHTTPNPIVINTLIRQMVNEGCAYCFMEVSSHALHQKRVSALDFDAAIFTNLTHDHLDYHQTMPAYIKAKKSFFDSLSTKALALSNIDDKNGSVMLQNCQARQYSYALKKPADFKCKVAETDWEGSLLNINGHEVWCQLTGLFNAYNITAIYATAILLGQESLDVLKALSQLQPAAGRFQVIRAANGKTAIVDYAHTPDALENVLQTIVNIKAAKANVITVVGCGGDRDKSKRPLMAQVAEKYSWRCLFTSDNPRTESPETILDDMMQGLTTEQQASVLRISQRQEAIKTAALLAQATDVILIAGKGHETYQEINGVRHHFDDTEVITDFFKKEK